MLLIIRYTTHLLWKAELWILCPSFFDLEDTTTFIVLPPFTWLNISFSLFHFLFSLHFTCLSLFLYLSFSSSYYVPSFLPLFLPSFSLLPFLLSLSSLFILPLSVPFFLDSIPSYHSFCFASLPLHTTVLLLDDHWSSLAFPLVTYSLSLSLSK